jgi:Ca2+-binding RTX toxin-like protein
MNPVLNGKVQLGGIGTEHKHPNGKDFIYGGFGHDYLQGDGGRDVIRGQGGRDTILGGSGNDILQGGAGRDRIEGGTGNDMLRGDGGNDTLVGGDGEDRFVFRIDQRSGNDRIMDWQGGIDVIEFRGDNTASLERFEIRQMGDHVDINWDNGSIRLINTDAGGIDAGDFVFL